MSSNMLCLLATALAVVVEVLQAQEVTYGGRPQVIYMSPQQPSSPPGYAPSYQQPVYQPRPVQPVYQPVYQYSPPLYAPAPQVALPQAAPVSSYALPAQIHALRVQAPNVDPIHAYVPPSANPAPCPPNYLCCGNHKHYDPHRVKTCCGDSAYQQRLQSCVNGMVVSIVRASPTPAPTPPPVFVQRVQLTCEGIKFTVPYPNFACCGPTVYNMRTEVCHSGHVSPVSNSATPPNLFFGSRPAAVVGRLTSTPPPAGPSDNEILVCQGHRHKLPDDTVSSFYGCCGANAIFWPTEQCVNGEVSPPRVTSTTTSATPNEVPTLRVCNGAQHWIPSTQVFYYGCCGTEIYDFRVDTCRLAAGGDGLPSSQPDSTGSSQNCTDGFICCEDFPAVEDVDGTLICCPGIGPYDPSSSTCPSKK